MQELKCIQIQILLFSAQHLIETTTKKNSKVMYLQRKKNQYIRYLNLHKAQTHLKRKLVFFLFGKYENTTVTKPFSFKSKLFWIRSYEKIKFSKKTLRRKATQNFNLLSKLGSVGGYFVNQTHSKRRQSL